MCCYERPGKAEHQAAEAARRSASQETAWQTANQQRRPAQPLNGPAMPTGKSKAQSKNEKRRAKKRADGSDF